MVEINPFDTDKTTPVDTNEAAAPAASSNPWDELDKGEEDVSNDAGMDAGDDSSGDDLSADGEDNATQIDAAIEQVQQQSAQLVDYVRVATEAIKEASGKSDPLQGLIFLAGEKGMPFVEDAIVKAIEKAKLPAIPDWVYNVPGGVAGAVIDAFIIFGPSKLLPPQARAIIVGLTAVSWGAAAFGPFIEGWMSSKYGRGSVATQATEIATDVLKSVNPRLALLKAIKLLQKINWSKIKENIQTNQQTIQDTAWGLVPNQNMGGKVDMRAKFYNNGGVACGPKVKRSGIYKH